LVNFRWSGCYIESSPTIGFDVIVLVSGGSEGIVSYELVNDTVKASFGLIVDIHGEASNMFLAARKQM
jgi:hypothetical protein